MSPATRADRALVPAQETATAPDRARLVRHLVTVLTVVGAASLAVVLAGYGLPVGTVAAAIVIYRVLELWIPFAIGAVAAHRLRPDADRDAAGLHVAATVHPPFGGAPNHAVVVGP